MLTSRTAIRCGFSEEAEIVLLGSHPRRISRPTVGLWSAWAGWKARHLLRRHAIVLDTETTDLDGEIVEIAVVDANTETVLINSLVRPTAPINPAATAVHGITDHMVAGAPTWPTLWPQIRNALAGRPVTAFNAPFDQGRIAADCHRHGIRPPRLRWTCLMRLDARRRRGLWRKLDGGHRALGDSLAAARLLRQIGHGYE